MFGLRRPAVLLVGALLVTVLAATAVASGLYSLITVPPAATVPQPDGTTNVAFNIPAGLAATIAADRARGFTEVRIVAGEQPTPAPGALAGITTVSIPPSVLAAATAMTMNIVSPLATLSLPPALVSALAQANIPLQLEISRPAPTAVNAERPLASTVLGPVTGIKTPIAGRTQVTLNLNLPLPTNAAERQALLANLGVFALHSDGEQQMIYDFTTNIDTTRQPPVLIGVSFNVDRFSQFAVVRLEPRSLFIRVNTPGFEMAGVRRDMQAAFYLRNDTMMPVRLLEEFGVNFHWNEGTRTATMSFLRQEVKLTIGSTDAVINGVRTPIRGASGNLIAPELRAGRTMIPLRFVSENLGFDVLWSPSHDIAIWRR